MVLGAIIDDGFKVLKITTVFYNLEKIIKKIAFLK
jgi:hypothetical protein